MELNKVFLIGNLTRDPETRHLQSGSQVCNFGLAVNRRYSVNGEKREETMFIDVKCWGKTAEFTSQYLQKGSQVLVIGRLETESWEKDGQKRSKTVVSAETVSFGARPKDGEREQPRTRTESNQRNYDDDYPESQNDDPGDLPF